MRVAAVQMMSGPDIEVNLVSAKSYIRQAAQAGARLIVLPEATSQAFGAGRLDTQAEDLDGHFASELCELATELGVVVVAGMFRPADMVGGMNRVYNTALITGGGHHTGYDKMHTYDAFDYRESNTVCPGSRRVLVEVDGLTIGVAICYDIRFPEHFQQLAREGAQAIVVPTSWADGPHKVEAWRILTAARALDSTCYIIAADQARPSGVQTGPTGIGHSTIVGPDGVRIVEAGDEVGIIYAEIDTRTVERARRALPVLRR